VLVGASGFVGHFAVQIAKWKGANVIAVASNALPGWTGISRM
jgi:NADPH:quinone reductase-like Zn-dependent oxidoreductase